jgi:hypothetical protein
MPTTNDRDTATLNYMLDRLSQDELEVAARTNYD